MERSVEEYVAKPVCVKLFSILILSFLIPAFAIAQEVNFKPVTEEAQYSGYWKLESFSEDDIGVQLLKDVDCPGGYYFTLKNGSGYLSSYIDEDGAAIDFGFSYEVKNGKFKAIYDSGNAIGHLMMHKGTEFSFILYCPKENGDKILKLVNSKKEEFVFIPY